MARPLELAPARVDVVERSDGTTLVRSPVPLAAHAGRVTEWLLRWARERPDTTFLAERGPTGEVTRISYSQAWISVIAPSTSIS